MILQALVELAENEKLIDDPDFEFKPVSWIVRLDADGRVLAVEDHRLNLNDGQVDKKGKPIKAKWIGRKALIPLFPSPRPGTKPKAAFLADMAKFVFGIEPLEETTDGSLIAYVERFRTLVIDCETDTNDPSVAAVRKMMDRVVNGEAVATLPADVGPSDLFAFRVGDDAEFVHQRPSVMMYWKQLRAVLPAPGGDETVTRCLVTGVPIVGAPPLFPPIKGVPGTGAMGSGLLPFNGPSAVTWSSFGLDGNANAPVSRLAAEAAAKALNRLANPRPTDGTGAKLAVRRIQLSPDTIVVFWSPEATPQAQSVLDLMPDLMGEPSFDATPRDPAEVGNLLAAYRTGVFTPIAEPAKFYAMTLTGTTGRIVVRDWFETTVAVLQSSISVYASQLGLAHRRRDPLTADRSQWYFARLPSLAAIRHAIAQGGKKDLSKDKALGNLMSEFWRLAMNPNREVKLTILSRAITRLQSQLSRQEPIPPATYALLKLFLVRDGDNDMTASVNKLHPNPAYHAGRLMAALAEIQKQARRGINKDEQANVTIIRRYFGAAMASPGLYFGRLLAMAEKAHLPKIAGKRARYLRDTIGEILGEVRDSLPQALHLKEQSLFTLGFYHQQSVFRGLPNFRFMTPTKQGDWVCSKGEQVVADALTELGHRWWHETSVNVGQDVGQGQRTRSPDFLLYPSTPRDRCFVEVLGMMERADYKARWEDKKKDYAAVGILPYGDKGDAPNGRLFWINTSKQETSTSDAPSFCDQTGGIDSLKVKTQLLDWFGDKFEGAAVDSATDDSRDANEVF